MGKVTMVRLPEELVLAVDRVRGDVPRERWVRRQLEEALGAAMPGPAGAEVSRPAITSRTVPASPRAAGVVPAAREEEVVPEGLAARRAANREGVPLPKIAPRRWAK